MLDLLIGLCYFAGICVMSALAIDIGIGAYHRAVGSPTAKKVMEELIKTNGQTIAAQRVTISSQQSEIRIHKARIKELEEQLLEALGTDDEGALYEIRK